MAPPRATPANRKRSQKRRLSAGPPRPPLAVSLPELRSDLSHCTLAAPPRRGSDCALFAPRRLVTDSLLRDFSAVISQPASSVKGIVGQGGGGSDLARDSHFGSKLGGGEQKRRGGAGGGS